MTANSPPGVPDEVSETDTPGTRWSYGGDMVADAPGVRSEGEAPRARSRDRASAMIEASLDCVVTIDAAGTVVEFNPAAERTLGWTREEALGRELAGLIMPPDLAVAHRHAVARFSDDTPSAILGRRLELPVLRRDGRLLTMELMVVPIEHEGRREFTGFLRDVTELRETQAQLHASQQRYEAIVRHSTRALILCAPERGESVFLAGTATLGYQPGTSLPGGFIALVHPDDRARGHEFLTDVREGERPPGTTTDLRLQTGDGRWIVGEVSGEDLSQVPAVAAVLLRISDVSAEREQQRRLADTTAQMRTLIDNLGSAVLLEDSTRHVLVANDALVELFDIAVPASEFSGVDCSQAAHQIKHLFADPDSFVRGVDAAVGGHTPSLGTRLDLAGGGTLERDYLPILVEGRPAGHLWVYRDITASIAQQVLLEDQNQALAALAEMKNEFVARASHELRSPLTSVVSFTDMLADARTGPLNEEQGEYVAVILRNAERLLRLIEDLLLVTKLESHTLTLSLGLVDPLLLARQVVTEIAPSAARDGVELTCSGREGPRVRADAVRLQQVLANVVANAVTYTPEGGTVTVRVEPDDEAPRWRLVVTDTGVGIRADELPLVFDAFYRASSASGARGAKGTGLGLSIVRLIVDQHHGTIDVASTPGVGTTFTVLLPFEDA